MYTHLQASLALQRHGGMAPVTGVLEWKKTSSLGRRGGKGGGEGKVVCGRLLPSVNEQLECMEHCLGMGEELTENLWARIKRRTGAGDITVGVCSWSPDQEDQADEDLYRQIEAASCS